MLTDKQIRMFTLLDEQIQSCKDCDLYNGGRAKPYWDKESIWVIIGEAPGKDEVTNNSPFVGIAARHLWEVMTIHKLERKFFLILNTTNCRPTDGRKNLKPNSIEISTCRKWIRKYLKVLRPQKILLLGSYALDTILSESGIMELNATTIYSREFECDIVRSIHPSMCIYYGNKGKQMLYNSIKLFKEI